MAAYDSILQSIITKLSQLLVPASSTSYGFMSPSDKEKLDGISSMTGATSSSNGKSGMVPAPAAGDQTKFLRADGTWVVPTDTTYNTMTGATVSDAGAEGLVPAPAAGKQESFLRGDGTWATVTSSSVDILTADPTNPKEGYMWIKKSS